MLLSNIQNFVKLCQNDNNNITSEVLHVLVCVNLDKCQIYIFCQFTQIAIRNISVICQISLTLKYEYFRDIDSVGCEYFAKVYHPG